MRAENTGITEKLVQNIFGSTLYKAFDVVFNFLLVRYAIQFFGAENYGVWLTLLSFFTWFSVIEFGISSSFRNRLTQLFADKKFAEIKTWISKGYKATTLIYSSVILVFLLVFNSISNPFENYPSGFGRVFQVSFVLYMVHYMFFFLHTVLLATHHTRFTYLITALQKGVSLLGIIVFIYGEFEPSLGFICLWFSSVPLLVWAFASLFSYSRFLKKISPSFTKTFQQKTNPLAHIQRAFFIIQICTLIICSTDNIIIMNQLTGTDVTRYNIAFKYFNILIIIFNIVLLPYWSSFTEAAHRKDVNWIKKNVKRLVYFWALIAFGAVCMLFISPFAYELWIGEPVSIPFELSVFMGLSVLVTCWNNIFAYFLNSISALKRQMTVLITGALVNVPLSLFLLNYMGLSGVIVATCIVLFPLSIVLPLHYRAIIHKMAS